MFCMRAVAGFFVFKWQEDCDPERLDEDGDVEFDVQVDDCCIILEPCNKLFKCNGLLDVGEHFFTKYGSLTSSFCN
ncbi:hypothetical protein BpHYR1_024793 [Brachionus plicatilis]|uniref:Uncharacterized protein n=1 Tax=Brachionus plicatilis TaxID=10195 RepID=A0A3M7PVS9_BRAPC|nr:hypothetical protein BpHYR1_024793 [Brachionus plicatilis]